MLKDLFGWCCYGLLLGEKEQQASGLPPKPERGAKQNARREGISTGVRRTKQRSARKPPADRRHGPAWNRFPAGLTYRKPGHENPPRLGAGRAQRFTLEFR